MKVADYSQYGQGWALYRFGCAIDRISVALPCSAVACTRICKTALSISWDLNVFRTTIGGAVSFICFLLFLLFQLSAGRFSRMGWLGGWAVNG